MEHSAPGSKPINYARRLRIWETDYGRTAGWILEQDDQPIASLTYIEWAEMFWDIYEIEFLTQDPMRSRLQSQLFWDEFPSARILRNRELTDVSLTSFPVVVITSKPDRLLVRSLYLRIEPPRAWDNIVLWMRKIIAQNRSTKKECGIATRCDKKATKGS